MDPAFWPSVAVLLLAAVQAYRSDYDYLNMGMFVAALSTAIALFWRDNTVKEEAKRGRGVSFEGAPLNAQYSSPSLRPSDELYEEAVPQPDSRPSTEADAMKRVRADSIQPDARSPPAHHMDPPPRVPQLDIRNHLFDIAPPAYPEVVYPNSRVPFSFGNEYFEGVSPPTSPPQRSPECPCETVTSCCEP